MTFADRRPHRRGRDRSSADPGRRRSRTPASSANSKGCEHDEARRPHRPPGGPFAVRGDAAGGLRPRSASTPAYELWDRAPIALADAIAELRTDDFLGANVTIPHKERVVPQVDRLTEEAHATGAVNTLTKEGRKLVGHNTDVPGFKVALDQLVGRQKMPRNAVVLGAGGGARAVVYGLIREGFQRVIVFNRHLHRAEGMVKHFGRSAAHMELRAMPWHESIIEAELAKTKVLVNATSIGLTADETPDAGRDPDRRSCSCST